MNTNYTPDQILNLAPDAASAKAAQKLSASQWVLLSRTEDALWGQYKGSGQTPYNATVDLNGPAFKCSCPSRKLPCKHGLALLLRFVSQPDLFNQGQPPDWARDWLEKRRGKSRPPASAPARDPEAQQKRAARRQQNILSGTEELDRHLNDLIGQGLANLQLHGYRMWDELAARMVDAQAPGLARLLRQMAGIPATGAGWPGRMLERMALLKLVTAAYARYDDLPETSQMDLRSVVGWTTAHEEVLSGPAVHDIWMVTGIRLEKEQSLLARSTWLWGQQSGQSALLLDFAYSGSNFEETFLPGAAFEGEVVFYPGSWPLRAIVKQVFRQASLTDLGGYVKFDQALESYALALARNPWIEIFPFLVADVVPLEHRGQWLMRDSSGKALAIRATHRIWDLLAISGGYPVTLSGEWDGATLLALGVWSQAQFTSLMEDSV